MRKEEQNFVEIEDDAVGQLLGGLKRVEAPGDFDFHVKARIAKGRPAARNASLIPSWLRVAVPLVLILFVGGYFGFRSIYSPDVNVEPVGLVKEEQPVKIAPIDAEPSAEVAEVPLDGTVRNPIEVKPPITDDKIVASVNKSPVPERLVVKTGSSNRNSDGSSRVSAQRIARPITLVKPKEFENPVGINARDILMQLGINATYSEASWKIGVVTQNSIAERSGLKAGDVIEAINDQNLSEKTTLAMPFSGKNIRVRRDGKIMQIDLKR